ncbi:hypothetical protein [Embleya scabrispora]|uniref:hypothetical protein n=1 Tax=Embleya scabrispora TaxID=159449 RepID=UPI00035FBD47|nr:hypothetical protein [Embleya scabrispora]MYS86252.1 hypothetical protein [Streptomyces sp. SID5474]
MVTPVVGSSALVARRIRNVRAKALPRAWPAARCRGTVERADAASESGEGRRRVGSELPT